MYNYLNNNFVDRGNQRNIDIFGEYANIFNNNNMGFNDMNNMMSDGSFSNNMMNNNVSLAFPKEGYIRGNLFNNLYSQYKNYQPSKLNARSDKERLFNEMSENFFSAHELNLYLDLFPNDKSMLTLFNDYRVRANKLKDEYEKMYGPVCITSDVLNNTPFLWQTMSWPWEGDNK